MGKATSVSARLSRVAATSQHTKGMMRVLAILLCAGSALTAKAKEPKDPRDCEVCKAVLTSIDESVTAEQRKDVEKIEAVMQTYCDAAKGKEKTMCYYMGVGDKEQGTAGGREARDQQQLRPWHQFQAAMCPAEE